jgi:predicted nucleic acid-binding Zn ribbon protein
MKRENEEQPGRRGPKPIGPAIHSVLEGLGIDQKVKRYEVVDRWSEFVGEQIARVATAELITPDGKLFVRVSQAPWRNELTFMKKDLIAKINQGMRQEVVHDIIFR